jgi:hypothetical protein
VRVPVPANRCPEDHKFKGLMCVDDVHSNAQVEKWWEEIKDNTSQWGCTVHNVTPVGHYSATGLLDFSGKVVIIK